MAAVTRMELKNRSVKVAQILINAFFIIASLCVILPLLLVAIVSFSSEYSVLKNGYSFFPEEFSLDGYRMVFSNNMILNAYGVTIFVTVVGTFLSVLFMSGLAFTLSYKKCKHRNKLALFLYLPTLFNPGIVPAYINITENLHLTNNIWVLILPALVGPWNVFMIRNYFSSISDSLIESFQMDGASQFRVFFQLMLPLSKPIIATISLFVALGFWNDYYLALWYITDVKLYPLQFFLQQLSSNIQYYQSGATVPGEPFFLAMMFVTIGPIILVYPFVQRYFVKGIMIGAVKG